MTDKYKVGPSPHVLGPKSVSSIMWDVVIALIPVSLVAILNFGISAVVVLATATLSAMIFEALVLKKSLKPACLLGDGSAAVTGLLVGLILPPAVPIWLVILASGIAILLAKQAFGGIGNNIFNPALVARAVVFMSWPVIMTTWHLPQTLSNWFTPLANFITGKPDVVTGATPLAGSGNSLTELFLGNIGGSLGEISALAILLGGVYLFLKGHIDWRIPGGYIGTAAIFALVTGLTASLQGGADLSTSVHVMASLESVAFNLTAGGVLFAAIFMATDMVTSPTT